MCFSMLSRCTAWHAQQMFETPQCVTKILNEQLTSPKCSHVCERFATEVSKHCVSFSFGQIQTRSTSVDMHYYLKNLYTHSDSECTQF